MRAGGWGVTRLGGLRGLDAEPSTDTHRYTHTASAKSDGTKHEKHLVRRKQKQEPHARSASTPQDRYELSADADTTTNPEVGGEGYSL